MKKLSLLFTGWLLFFCLFAQERTGIVEDTGLPHIPRVSTGPYRYETPRMRRNPWVNQATLAGIGQTFLLDTYLSPLRYDGTSLSILHERIHATRLFSERLLLQHQFHIQLANTTNPIGNATQYYANLSYHLNGLYPVMDIYRFRLFVGGGIDASLGGIYNTRNSNNPGSAKASSNLNLAVMARYNWNRFTFRWQLSTPFAGLFFAPGFGQSYFEIFALGNTSGTTHFGSFHNQQALRNYFTVDIPLRNFTIRTGYLGNYYRTDVNSLITNIRTHQFMIGIVSESLSLGGRRSRKANSVFY